MLVELELVSQVSAVNLDGGGRDAGEHIGGRRPPGGIDHRDDRELGWDLKSPEHYRRRLANVHSDATARLILSEIHHALEAHKRQPPPSDRPELSSPQWKRWVGESSLSAREIARIYSVSRQYVDRVRARYSTA